MWILAAVGTNLSGQDVIKWLEIRYSFVLPDEPPPNYGELTALVREFLPQARQLRNEHAAQFLRKHSVRQVHAISLFKSQYRDISDSTLALATLYTGLNEVFHDRTDLAGAGRLSTLQAMKCGLRIDAVVDERFKIPENLRCLQAWMRAYPNFLTGFFNEFAGEHLASDEQSRHLFDGLLSYFSQIRPAEIPLTEKTILHQHPYAVSISQWIVLRSDLKMTEALNPVFRINVIPPYYPVLIPKETKEFNTPVPYKPPNRILDKQQLAPTYVKHVVIRGETLTQISKKYGVSIQSIQRVNSIQNDKIFEGQVLLIPDKE